jgi:hypothetical protein
MHLVRFASLVVAACVAASCEDRPRSPAGPSGAPTPTTLRIVGAVPSLGVGESQQLRAAVAYSDGTTSPPAGDVTWTSSNDAVYTLWPGGLALAVGPGAATLTASSAGLTGSTTLTVEARPGGVLRVQGRVLDSRSGAGVADALVDFWTPPPSREARTDGTGGYGVDLPPGVREVTVNGMGAGFMRVRVGGPAFRADLYVPAAGCTGRYGLVADAATHRPVTGAIIRYAGVEAVTGVDGWYRLDHSCAGSVPGGTAAITATHPEYTDYLGLTGRGVTGYWRHDVEMWRR